jgi:hypothetical protein
MSAASESAPGMPVGARRLEPERRALHEGGGNTSGAAPGLVGGAQ